MAFELISDFSPSGDQPQAIGKLVEGLNGGKPHQVLLGVTGSGKTFTIANAIQEVQRPALVIAHNKTLAAQLCAEFRAFFPNNVVEYFISYYDYYQPEAYIASRDVYIEKEADINQEIERLRHSATRALLTRRDVIIVASVSCIYGLGSPEEYLRGAIQLDVGKSYPRRKLLLDLEAIQYERNDIELIRGRYRVKGDAIDIFPAWSEHLVRLEFFGDELERVSDVHPVSGEVIRWFQDALLFPATHYVVGDALDRPLKAIRAELEDRVLELKAAGKLVEAQRLEQRTRYDLEMMAEMGACKGIENYSRHLDGRAPGEPPSVLLDFFPKDFVTIVDESHVTIPQIRGMYAGDRSRKTVLVAHGFRLPSAMDNRPLKFEEFEGRIGQCIHVSATPGGYELEKVRWSASGSDCPSEGSSEPASLPLVRPSEGQSGDKQTRGGVGSSGGDVVVGDGGGAVWSGFDIVEQIIRPTGLLDPRVEIRSTEGQIDHLMDEIQVCLGRNERVLVTTLTKKMSEELTDFLDRNGVKVRYLHSEIDALTRVDILRSLRLGEFDVLVGVNLLREGLDLPEVSLVAIMDADKEGFLRNERSLIQTMGRAARNANGRVVLYADKMTDSLKRAVAETQRRRTIQAAYNAEHGITPTTIIKKVQSIREPELAVVQQTLDAIEQDVAPEELPGRIMALEKQMQAASDRLEFELAAVLRDEIERLAELEQGRKKRKRV